MLLSAMNSDDNWTRKEYLYALSVVLPNPGSDSSIAAASASIAAVDHDASDGRTRSSPLAVVRTVTTDGSSIGPTRRAWSMTWLEKVVGTGELLLVLSRSRDSIPKV